ncbi:MAG: hypothetical protein ACI9LO_003170 [Planctomycetota bacterium]|jgi:hypothetical protein
MKSLHWLMLVVWGFSLSVHAVALKPIDVNLTTHLGDQQTFIEGDQLSFYLSLDTDSYVYLLYQDAQDQSYVLIPNANMPANFYAKRLFLPLPDAVSTFRFTIQAPFGNETIMVFASDFASPELFSSTVGNNGLVKIDTDLEQLRADLELVATHFGYAELRLTTRPKPDN